MTGYGRCRVCRDGREMTLELKTVNHRFLDISFRLPKNLLFVEDALRSQMAKGALLRGHADVFVTYLNTRADARAVTVDKPLLDAFNAAVDEASGALKRYKPLRAGEALGLSGAISIAQAEEDAQAVTDLALEALGGAMEQLLLMRTREGEHLAKDLLKHLEALEALRQQIALQAPQVPMDYRKRLEARIQEWQVDAVDPQRVAQEVAMMADRCAIDEELSRLEGHIRQFAQSVSDGGEVGRKLDFLIQEMNREINTIGSKASHAAITQAVVDAKCVVEKLREQVQNAV